MAPSCMAGSLQQVHHMHTGNRGKINATLQLLSAIASRGPQCTRDLVSAFDFTLSSLPKLSRPSNTDKARDGGAGGLQQLQRYWRARAVAARPTRALFVEFGECQACAQCQTLIDSPPICEVCIT